MFRHSELNADPEAKGLLLIIETVEPRTFKLKHELTLKQAEELACLRT